MRVSILVVSLTITLSSCERKHQESKRENEFMIKLLKEGVWDFEIKKFYTADNILNEILIYQDTTALDKSLDIVTEILLDEEYGEVCASDLIKLRKRKIKEINEIKPIFKLYDKKKLEIEIAYRNKRLTDEETKEALKSLFEIGDSCMSAYYYYDVKLEEELFEILRKIKKYSLEES